MGYVGKGAVAIVVEETALADAGDEDVGEAVIVVVSDCHAHAVEFKVESGGFGDIGEGAVAIVAVELEGGSLALVAGPVHGIDEEDVGPAVGVVIEESATGAESFGEEFVLTLRPSSAAISLLDLPATMCWRISSSRGVRPVSRSPLRLPVRVIWGSRTVLPSAIFWMAATRSRSIAFLRM